MEKFSVSNFMIILLGVFSSRTAHAVYSKYTLPTSIQPIKYKLELLIDEQHEWPYYEERVTITIKCVEENTDEIFVNVNRSNLIIKEKDVRVKPTESASNQEFTIGVRHHVPDVENDIHIIQLSTSLKINEEYEVLIPFEKTSSSRARGYYVDEHEDTSKNGREFIATQLGPGEAREIFPCLDQIKWKTPFKVFLKHPGNFLGFSNMRRMDTKKKSNFPHLVEDEFEESPPMSTNNIAFVLLDSNMFQELDVSVDKRIQLYAAETILNKMQFAYAVSSLAMHFFSEFFENPYALSNLYMIALPNFVDKDKPKYGIITVPDSNISSPDNSKEDIAVAICHSMSHQWLGTYVTVSSWNIYWLLEAFAYSLEKPCLKFLFPENRLSFFDYLLVRRVAILLPYEVEAKSFTLLDFNYFDKIDSYGLGDPIFAKAFCLVQMLNFSFGDKFFQKFMASYMQTPSSAGTSLEHVGNVFTRVVNSDQTFLYHIDVNEYMKSWISKKAFPLLTVSRSRDGRSVKIEQKNFGLYYDSDETIIHENSCWMMPLRFFTNKDEAPDNNRVYHWMDCTKPFNKEINADSNDWMILDLRWNVLCRVNYDDENWNAIQSMLTNPKEYSRINVMSRVQLVSDMFAFLDTGILSCDRVFGTMKFLAHEDSFLSMDVAVVELLRIRDRLLGSETLFPLFQEYVRKILEMKFDKQGAVITADSSQTDFEKYRFERVVIRSSCIFDLPECQQLGKMVFDQWHFTDEEEEEIADDRDSFYCQAMKSANMMEWKFLWKQYDVLKGSKFNNDILMALGCSSDEGVLTYLLNWSVGRKDVIPEISPEDSPKVFSGVAMNEKGYPVMKNFLLENFDNIKTFLSGSSVSVDIYLKKLLDITTKTEDLYDLRAIIENNYETSAHFETNLKRAERNIWWRKENDVKLELYFQTSSLPSELERKM